MAYKLYLLRDCSLPETIFGGGFMPIKEQSLCVCREKSISICYMEKLQHENLKAGSRNKGFEWELLFPMEGYIENDVSPGREEISHTENLGKGVPERGNSKCKVPEVEIYLALLREP